VAIGIIFSLRILRSEMLPPRKCIFTFQTLASHRFQLLGSIDTNRAKSYLQSPSNLQGLLRNVCVCPAGESRSIESQSVAIGGIWIFLSQNR
jgi:hypothetical protein